MIDADPLMARREDWGGLLPEGVAVLTAGVDLQGDRLELHVVVGAATRNHGRSTTACWGDPCGARVWADLDTALAARGCLLASSQLRPCADHPNVIRSSGWDEVLGSGVPKRSGTAFVETQGFPVTYNLRGRNGQVPTN